MALFVFLFSVHGLATAIAVLKVGKFFFGQGYCAEDEGNCGHPKHPYELRRFLGRIPKLGDLFYCTPCLSFWIGMGVSWKVLSPSGAVVQIWWQAMVLDGLMACAASWLLFLVAKKLEHGLDV